MLRRPGKKSVSTKVVTIRVTPGEGHTIAFLARKRGALSVSDYLRQLVADDLERLVAAGVKVPRR